MAEIARPRVLLGVDDSPSRHLLHSLLVGEGCDVVHARGAADLLRLLRSCRRTKQPYALVLCAVHVYSRSDLDVLADVLHVAEGAPVLFVPRTADEATRSAARGLGATWVMPGAPSLEDVRGAARFVIRREHRRLATHAESA